MNTFLLYTLYLVPSEMINKTICHLVGEDFLLVSHLFCMCHDLCDTLKEEAGIFIRMILVHTHVYMYTCIHIHYLLD